MVARNQVQVTLINSVGNKLPYIITTENNSLAHDWLAALNHVLANGLRLNKSYCFLGFPRTLRSIEYLCSVLNNSVYAINTHDWEQYGLAPYRIEEWFAPDVVRFGQEYAAPVQMYPEMLFHSTKHEVMNRVHNHFEKLQGTIDNPSNYARLAPEPIKKAIGRLNTVCHEIENLVLSQRKHLLLPEWTRPCQITTFDHAPRYELTAEHRQLFLQNGFNRKFGGVYMHWAQIGKTYFEVFRDEHAPELTNTVCEAITQLKYYSGEFDVEWGKTIVDGVFDWHDKQMLEFKQWLADNGIDATDPNNSLGYLPIGQIDVAEAFGTDDPFKVWDILSDYLDIHSIETADHACVYHHTWRDEDA